MLAWIKDKRDKSSSLFLLFGAARAAILLFLATFLALFAVLALLARGVGVRSHHGGLRLTR